MNEKDEIINKDQKEQNNKEEMKKCFNELSEQYLLQGALARRISQYIKDNSNNEVLMNYLKMLNDIDECQKEVSKKKDELYEKMEELQEKSISNEFIEVTCKYSYKRTKFDDKAYFIDNPIDDKTRKKYTVETICKGNITIKEQRKI